MAGADWFQKFLKTDVSVRQATSFNTENVKPFYGKVSEVLSRHLLIQVKSGTQMMWEVTTVLKQNKTKL
jgi:hypothetical protein